MKVTYAVMLCLLLVVFFTRNKGHPRNVVRIIIPKAHPNEGYRSPNRIGATIRRCVNSVTLIRQPPRFSSELNPTSLSIETYPAILQSDYMIDKVKTSLEKKQLIDAGSPLQVLKTRLSVEIFEGRVGTRGGNMPFMPIIDLVARADSPHEAAETANTWAAEFLEQSAELNRIGKQGSLELIEAQYPMISESLVRNEDELKNKEDSYANQLRQIQAAWDQRILDHTLETARLETTF